MAYEKGKKVERGIWRLAGSRHYLAEISFVDPETRKRARRWKTFNRLELAQQWRRKMQDEDARRQMSGSVPLEEILFRDFAIEYLESWSIDRKASTVAGERRRIDGILIPAFGDMPIHTITRRDIDDYLTGRRQTVTKATANRDLCRLKNMLRKAVEWDYIQSNPAAEIKQGREQIVPQDFLSSDEVAGLIESCDDRIRPVVVAAVHTGMRWGELMALEWGDINFDRGNIHVRDPKNGEDRHIPMNDELAQALSALRFTQTTTAGQILRHVFVNPESGAPWRDIRKPFRKAMLAAGITRSFPIKNLRHTCASHLAMAGVDLRTIGAILGHKTPQVTLRYAHLSPGHLREAIGHLKFGRAKVSTQEKA